MGTYILKRLMIFPVTLFGITLITFFVMKLAPGNPVATKMQAAQGLQSEALSGEVYEQTLKLYGLKVDLPKSYENFIAWSTKIIHGRDSKESPPFTRKALYEIGQATFQYITWLKGLAQLNFGSSLKDFRPVWDKIKEALPITLILNLISLFIVYFVSIPMGAYSALKRGGLWDQTTMILMFFLYSLPSFWIATLLLVYFAEGDFLGWFPLGGLTSDGAEVLPWFQQLGDFLWHLVLPVIAMVYGSFAFLSRFSRSVVLESLHEDFVRTARAKGLNKSAALWKHAFRHSLIPLITIMGTLLPALLGGSVIIEQIFNIPGMGRLAFESVLARDYPTIMAIATLSAFLTLVSLLLSDLSYAWVDPRVKLEQKSL
ncbi:MAG: ABC transporter permease [Deltaproteobacteria bacterium]|nr:ABC transporter permease [Deltaproteobacteria bacterium]